MEYYAPFDTLYLTVEIWSKSYDLYPVSTDPDSKKKSNNTVHYHHVQQMVQMRTCRTQRTIIFI